MDQALVEAALFVADGPVSLARLSQVLEADPTAVGAALHALAQDLEEEGRGIELVQEGGGYVLRIKPELAETVRPLAPHQDIPEPTLRTLAVIAYRGPLLQSELVRTRGQRAYGHVRELLARGFVQAEEEGTSKRLSVTDGFLRYFGLSSAAELRPPEDDSAGADAGSAADENVP
ncbi:MAG: SMC-Scp complex subunit ScpB [Candidatus Bipolaricaulota bacterium]